MAAHMIGPQGLKPAFRAVASGTAEEAAEKVQMLTSAPKGAIDSKQFAASLKRCPDTKPIFPAACEAVPCQTYFATSSMYPSRHNI